MRDKLNNFLRGWGWIRSERGFTLAEVLIVLVISGLLMFGSFEIVRHMVVTSSTDRNKANALCQVQYVGFWISEDVMQAKYEGVDLIGNATDPFANHFPVTVTWTEWDGDMNRVKFSLLPQDSSPGGVSLYELTRQRWFVPKGDSIEDPGTNKGTTTVGEFLTDETRCYWDTSGDATSVLKLEVTANVDGQVASRTYEINPRSQ